MAVISSFALQSASAPDVLVLGSIPGVASLQAVQYYAHPRNAFWPVMAEFFDFDRDLAYPQRLATLLQQGVALWDVLQRCERQGSLDSAIQSTSIQVNPIADWIKQNPQLRLVLLNGGKAATEFRKHFAELTELPNLDIQAMPSTSPAYAAMPYDVKKQRWHAALATVFIR